METARFLLVFSRTLLRQQECLLKYAALENSARQSWGGSVNAGNFLAPDNDGKLINAPQEAAPGTADLYVIAMALQDGADSEIIQVMVVSPYEVSTE